MLQDGTRHSHSNPLLLLELLLLRCLRSRLSLGVLLRQEKILILVSRWMPMTLALRSKLLLLGQLHPPDLLLLHRSVYLRLTLTLTLRSALSSKLLLLS